MNFYKFLSQVWNLFKHDEFQLGLSFGKMTNVEIFRLDWLFTKAQMSIFYTFIQSNIAILNLAMY